MKLELLRILFTSCVIGVFASLSGNQGWGSWHDFGPPILKQPQTCDPSNGFVSIGAASTVTTTMTKTTATVAKTAARDRPPNPQISKK
eukprot:4571534-Amphidinium_carterae.1